MDILLIEPFFTGSHKAWAEGYRRNSRHRVELLTLPGRYWKWRMHGGAVSLARAYRQRATDPDLILATDMLDLATFLALTRDRTAGIPIATYFHENQAAYPWSPSDRDAARGSHRHYQFLNYTSALAADLPLFNSRFNRDSFLEGIRELLHGSPDLPEEPALDGLATRCEVLPLGLDLAPFDEHAATGPAFDAPLVLWNHRWEHDKNPDGFFRVLFRLAESGLDFRVAVLGEPPRSYPAIFDEARGRLGERIVHFGFTDSFADYARWLWAADILPVTSWHDFFGISVMEAVYCRTLPLLPHRQAYPEILPEDWHEACLYTDEADLEARLAQMLQPGPAPDQHELTASATTYDWSRMIARYDDRLAKLAGLKPV